MTGVWQCVTMLMVVCVCLWGSAEAIGGAKSRPRPQRRPPKKPKVNPIDDTPPAQNIDIQQMGGPWYLINAASKCNFLMKNGLKVEATVMTLTPPSSKDTTLSVSTTTRLNHQCWEILQAYTITPTPGRLVLNGSRPLLNTDIVIGESDYSSYAVFYYQKQGQLTMKLYGRSKDTLSEAILDKFEDLAEKRGLGLAYVFAFPNYSHCESVDKDHVIKLSSRTHRSVTMMLRMMGVLLCAALVACIDVVPQKDFNLEKMAGRWWIVGFATNAHWFVSHKADMKMGTSVMLPTAGGDLDLTYTNLNADGTCWRMTHLAKKTDIPGRFTFTSQRWNNENDMRVVAVQYDDFALIHTIKTKDGVPEVLNKLYSRTPEVSTALQQKFMQFSLDTGIISDNIAILPKNGECTEA